MPFDNFLFTGFENLCGFNISGADRLLLIDNESILAITLQGEEVAAIEHAGAWKDFDKAVDIQYNIEPTLSKAGLLYNVSIDLKLPSLSLLHNALYDYIQDGMTAIVTDSLGQHWLVGHRELLDASKYDYGTDSQHYEISLSCSQKYKPLKVQDSVMATLQTETLIDCGWNMGGVDEFFLIKHDLIQRLFFDEGGVVSGMELVVGYDWNFFENCDDTAFAISTKASKNGTIYNGEMNFTIDGVRVDTSQLVERLANTGLSALVGDSNGKYWLVGYHQPFVLAQAPYGSTNANYQIKLASFSKWAPLEVDPAYAVTLPRVTATDGYFVPGYIQNNYTTR